MYIHVCKSYAHTCGMTNLQVFMHIKDRSMADLRVEKKLYHFFLQLRIHCTRNWGCKEKFAKQFYLLS